MIRVRLVDDIDIALATDRENAMTFAVIEKIVGIRRDLDLCDNIAGISIQNQQLRGRTAADE